MNTPLTDKVRYKCNDIAQIADAGFRGAYEAMTAHAEGLELEIKKERALADRLADGLRLADALFHAMPRNITTQAHRRSAVKMSTDQHPIDYVRSILAAWKEARRDS